MIKEKRIETKDFDKETQIAIRRLLKFEKLQEKYKKEMELIKKDLKDKAEQYGLDKEAEKIIFAVNGFDKIYIQNEVKSSFDKKTFSKENPELAKKYEDVKISTVLRFS